MDIKKKREEYAWHVQQARAIVNGYKGHMPGEQAAKAESHIAKAKELRAEIEAYESEPDYKHDMGLAGSGFTADSRHPFDTPRAKNGGVHLLTKGQSFADHFGVNVDKARGALGVIAKGLVADADPKEVAHFLGNEYKDILSTGSGGVLVPEPVAAFIIDNLRARAVVNRLGARTVPMASASLRVPQITSDAVPEWLGEGDTYGGTDAEMDGVLLEAKKLGQIVKFSEELDEDSDPELAGQMLADHLARVFAVELDRVALRGDGTANEDEPTGVVNTSGVQSSDDAEATWDTLTGIKRDLAAADAEVTGFVMDPTTSDEIENERGTDGHFIAPPRSLDGIARHATSAAAASGSQQVIGGDWSYLLIGMRSDFRLRRLDQRYADEGKVALRARLRADVAVGQPAAFRVRTIGAV